MVSWQCSTNEDIKKFVLFFINKRKRKEKKECSNIDSFLDSNNLKCIVLLLSKRLSCVTVAYDIPLIIIKFIFIGLSFSLVHRHPHHNVSSALMHWT